MLNWSPAMPDDEHKRTQRLFERLENMGLVKLGIYDEMMNLIYTPTKELHKYIKYITCRTFLVSFRKAFAGLEPDNYFWAPSGRVGMYPNRSNAQFEEDVYRLHIMTFDRLFDFKIYDQ